MSQLVKSDALIEDPYWDATRTDEIPPERPVLISLEQWREHGRGLLPRPLLGIRLASDEPPQSIIADLGHFTLVALEFPLFKDGRAYSYARLLRERYAFRGELRAVGDVLADQLHLMLRSGFDAFEIKAADPLAALRAARRTFSVWYQPTGDALPTALELRARGRREATRSA
jgi:uncharacterized protein (DUF934 family)